MSFSKFLARSTTAVRTGTFRYPANRMHTSINRCLRPAISHAQQRGGLPITILRHSTSLLRSEAKSLKHSREQHAGFREQEAIHSHDQQANSFQQFEDQLNRYKEQQAQFREQEATHSREHAISFQNFEDQLNRYKEQQAQFREQEATHSREHAISFQNFEDQLNRYREQQAQSREQETLGSQKQQETLDSQKQQETLDSQEQQETLDSQKQQVTLRSQKQLARSLEQFEGKLKRNWEQQDPLLKQFQELKQQFQMRVEQKNIQNHKLLVGSSLLSPSTRFLIFQQCAALEERTKRMKLEGRYNACGALERIVDQAILEGKISPTAIITKGLRELAEGREFTNILELEVKARKLYDRQVMEAFEDLYRKSKYNVYGNDGATIIVSETSWMDNERAALVCLLKLQSSWPCPLPWKEELRESPKGDK
ncbi:hypothetical protein B9Z19DRAFT_1069416 [Tuber borchii]|uniref:Uncharacterized protein n=1 Tax=Tuber borchii TaxID=42251 RepID=A0A2T6ZBL6_TUBBO|nr:hypothetical protein B9Z19DRAFT_1069416 [Tuber borchii]